jgi:hypothetical protein
MARACRTLYSTLDNLPMRWCVKAASASENSAVASSHAWVSLARISQDMAYLYRATGSESRFATAVPPLACGRAGLNPFAAVAKVLRKH